MYIPYNIYAGAYSFKVELTKLSASGQVELWIGTTSNPLNISKVLDLLNEVL